MSLACKLVSTRLRTNSSRRDNIIKTNRSRGEERLHPGCPFRHAPLYQGSRGLGGTTCATIRQHTWLIVPTWSGDNLDPFLFLGFLFGARLCRQLQDGRPLAGDETRQQHDAPIGEFQRIMMHVLLVLVDLAEARNA